MDKLTLVAAFFALVSHQVFKRHEPSLVFAVKCALIGHVLFIFYAAAFHSGEFTPSDILRRVVLTSSAYFTTLFSSILLYRVSFWHPLSSFPGPPIAKLSKFWAAWVCDQGETHRATLDLHRQYGDFIRTGPNELSIADPNALSTIYGPSGWEKGGFYASIRDLKDGEPSLQSTDSHAVHARRRRRWDHGFTTTALNEYQPQVRERVNQFIEAMTDRSQRKETIDIRTWFQYFTWDVMFDLAFGGRGPQFMEDGKDSHGFITPMQDAVQVSSTMGHIPAFTKVVKLFPDKNVFRFVRMVRDLFRDRMGDPAPVPDIFRFLVADLSASRSTPHDQQILREAQADVSLLIIGGSDTTGTVLVNLFFLLLTEPGQRSYKTLQAQLDAAYLEHADLDSNELAQRVPFLDCCINETMRLLPAVPFGPMQRKSPPGGAVVCGRFIPEGTHVTIGPYILHRDPRNFSDPDSFKPERWLPDAKGILNRDAFIPFSTGPYFCIGRQLAYQEMRLLSSALIRTFDMAPIASFNKEEFALAGKGYFTMRVVKPLPVVLQRRVLVHKK